MRAAMPDTLRMMVPAFLAAQALLVHWAAGSERAPAPPDFARFPAQFGEWRASGEDPIAPDIAAQLGADRILSRTYVRQAGGTPASLFVAWYHSQRIGSQQVHWPDVCLRGGGWTPETTGVVTLATAAGTITVNRYLAVNGVQRAVILYWYQTPRRVTAGEWSSKLWQLADGFRDKRTDTALVRVVVWRNGAHDEASIATAAGFSRTLYPLLREQLPR